MAVSFDDKLLGEKAHYYCSSSEDEDEGNDSDKDSESEAPVIQPSSEPTQPPEARSYQGYSTNTGPKGVIQDWWRFRQLQAEMKLEQEIEKVELGKKLSLTCRSSREDDREKEVEAEMDRMLEDLAEDDFLAEYRQKRLEEMRRSVENLPTFGKVHELTKDEFIGAIDAEKPQVTVIIHIFEDNVAACTAMNGCFACLASEYRSIKFCRIRASTAKLSAKFSSTGVPALLVYKNKELICNLVRVSDILGDDFFATDVEGLLLEHGLLPDKTLIPGRRASQENDESGSDFEID